MNQTKEEAPIAKKIAHKIEIHGDIRVDPYFWMRLSDDQKDAETPDDQTKDVLNYLKAENDYLETIMEGTKELEDQLYDEIIGRIKQDDESVPFKDNGYYYITRYEKGREYPIHSRKKGNLSSDEELMLNINDLAKPYNYYQTSGLAVSSNNRILAYGEDTLSRRIYTIKFKDLITGRYLRDEIPNTSGNITWANDNKTIFYATKDEALRPYKIFRHTLGTPVSEDVEVFHEKDDTFRTFVYKTKSKKYIVIACSSTLSNEFHILPADKPNEALSVFQSRVKELEYNIAHYDSKWYIRTNLNAENFKIMTCPEDNTSVDTWIDFIEYRPDILVEGIDIFKNYFVISERIKGTTQLRVLPKNADEYYISFPEKSHFVYTGKNPEFDTDMLRIQYTSLVTPNTVYDFNMSSKERILMKQQEIVGDFDSKNYLSESLSTISRDKVEIPISLVYRKGTKLDGSAPLLLFAYGSYGYSMDPYFSSIRLSLLDRGFIFAIPHIRGGQEMGRKWYYKGKLMYKKNTFNDFIDCAEHLLELKYSSREKLFAMGGSAGGLLMGAILNMRPDLWKGVIAAVPFVDVVSTMLDESIPLTTGEFDEWGNPKEKAYYEYIKSYSPYDNVERKDYPALLVTTGYFDSQVQYWEPAKWVAKLRDYKTNDSLLLLHTDLKTGHGGASGRFNRYKETALEYAFLLRLAEK